MVVALVALLGNAIIQSMIVENRKDKVVLESNETLTAEQCLTRFDELLKRYEHKPVTAKEYYVTLRQGYLLEGSVSKALEHTPSIWRRSPNIDFRAIDRLRYLQLDIPRGQNEYAQYLPALMGTPEQEKALQEYEASGSDPLHRQGFSVLGAERIFLWWLLFQVGAMPLVFIHFCIQLRQRGNKIFHDVFGNPAFPFWLIFWEVGLFRYPMKVSPSEQLLRARRWATLVLSSALSCFAGTGKVCEEKQEQSPQHQKYDGAWSPFTFSTLTLSNYVGLDGGVFFPAPVQQSNVTVALPCGAYANWFDSEPLSHRSLRPNFGREMDYTFGWSRTFHGYNVNANANYVNVFPLTKMLHGDVFQFNERLTKNIPLGKQNAIAPYLLLRQVVPAHGATPVGGNFIHWGVTFSHTFNDRVSASVTAEALHDSGAVGYRPGYIGRMIAGMNWKGSRGISWQFPQIMFADPLSHTADGRYPVFSFGIGLTFSPAH
jgi:hypothetical protein